MKARRVWLVLLGWMTFPLAGCGGMEDDPASSPNGIGGKADSPTSPCSILTNQLLKPSQAKVQLILSLSVWPNGCDILPALEASPSRRKDPLLELWIEELKRRSSRDRENALVAFAEAERRSHLNDDSALRPEKAWVTQWHGDDHTNNCAYASALGALRILGKEVPALDSWAAGLPGSMMYKQIMMLRKLSGDKTSDQAVGIYTAALMTDALNLAGAWAQTVKNTWGTKKHLAVEIMKQELLDLGRLEAFIVGGSARMGWSEQIDMGGGHFVVATSYDPETDTFTVLDPLVKSIHDPADTVVKVDPGPIHVTARQMENFLSYPGSENLEVTRVTAYP